MPTPLETRTAAAATLQTSFATFVADLATWRSAATATAAAVDNALPGIDAALRSDAHIGSAVIAALRVTLFETDRCQTQWPLAIMWNLAEADAEAIQRSGAMP